MLAKITRRDRTQQEELSDLVRRVKKFQKILEQNALENAHQNKERMKKILKSKHS